MYHLHYWYTPFLLKHLYPIIYLSPILLYFHHAFHQLDNRERRQRDIRDALLVDQGKNPSFNYTERMSGSDEYMDDFGDNDYMEIHDRDVKQRIDDDVEEIVQEINALQQKEIENQVDTGTIESE